MSESSGPNNWNQAIIAEFRANAGTKQEVKPTRHVTHIQTS